MTNDKAFAIIIGITYKSVVIVRVVEFNCQGSERFIDQFDSIIVFVLKKHIFYTINSYSKGNIFLSHHITV